MTVLRNTRNAYTGILLPLILQICWATSYSDEIHGAVVKDIGGIARTLDISGDGRTIAVGREDGAVILLDTSRLTFSNLIGIHSSAVRNVVFSGDQRKLLSASLDGSAKIWDIESGKQIGSFSGHESEVWCAVFSPGEKFVASSGSDNTIRIWDVRTAAEVTQLRGHSSRIRALAFSPDGKTIASGSDDFTVRVWDTATGEVLQKLAGHEGKIWRVFYFPSGKLISSSSDGTVRQWDAETGTQIKKLQAHTIGRNGKIRALDYLEKIGLFATGSEDHKIRVWNTDDWSHVVTLLGHSGHLTSVVFSWDGDWIYTASVDGTLRKFSIARMH